ncbi:hypothetical protein J6590_078469, partial [Homalodisca vitripennis]
SKTCFPTVRHHSSVPLFYLHPDQHTLLQKSAGRKRSSDLWPGLGEAGGRCWAISRHSRGDNGNNGLIGTVVEQPT